MPVKKPCQHLHMVPHIIDCGKKIVSKEFKKVKVDWKSVISLAHLFRVRTYYCPECKKLINVDKEITL